MHAGLEDRLRAGISVADLGCGCGLALQILALEFPNSTFHGFDTSQVWTIHIPLATYLCVLGDRP